MRIKLIVIFILFPVILIAQDSITSSSSSSLKTRFRPGAMWYLTGFRPAEEEKVRKYDRLIFDLTYNDWIGDRDLFKNHWASIGLNSNWMFDIPLAKQNVVALGIGVTHQWVNIRHDNHLNRIALNESTSFEMKSDLEDFNKSKYGSHTLLMPIELRFRTYGWKHFKFHIGGKIGYKFAAYSKYQGGDDFKYDNKTKNFYDQSKIVYSAHVRFGLRNWAFFGNYQFNRMFTSSESVQLNLLQFGLSVSLY